MTIDELKNGIKDLSVDDRRKVALYILELEKNHIQSTVGPQLTEDLEALGKTIQGAMEKIRNTVKGNM
jgi:hypothetical protein